MSLDRWRTMGKEGERSLRMGTEAMPRTQEAAEVRGRVAADAGPGGPSRTAAVAASGQGRRVRHGGAQRVDVEAALDHKGPALQRARADAGADGHAVGPGRRRRRCTSTPCWAGGGRWRRRRPSAVAALPQ